MGYGERARVQRQAADQRLFIVATFVSTLQPGKQKPRVDTVGVIVQDRQPAGHEVHPDLVRTICCRAALKPGKASESLQHNEPRHRGPAPFPGDAHATRPAPILCQRNINLESVLRRRPDHEGVIDSLHRFRLELSAQEIERSLRPGAQQYSARFVIEPVDIADLGSQRPAHGCHQTPVWLKPAARADREPARPVERDQDLILKYDRRQRH